jgi:hypothetical protein
MLKIEDVLYALRKFLEEPNIRWFFFLLVICFTVFLFIQEPVRFSGVHSKVGLPMKWHYYILAVLNAFNYVFTFLALWYTIPFTTKFPGYWYLPIFILILLIYTQYTISSRIVVDDGTFNSPPQYLLPKKYRLFFHYVILTLDIIIFIQFMLASGNINIEVKTYLDKYVFGKFGGFIPGNKLNFVVSWLALLGLANDIYNIYMQTGFVACKYNLPASWNI